MKTQLLFLKRIVVVICFFSAGIFMQGNAQQRNLKNELLVYILPDSLEMPASEKASISYTEAKILSKSLESALATLKPIAISKAFPDWNKADSIKTRKDGEKIKAPQFDRIFTLTFKSEEKSICAFCRKKFPAYTSYRSCLS